MIDQRQTRPEVLIVDDEESVRALLSEILSASYIPRVAESGEKALKMLPLGSVYSEPGGVNHFARTAEEPVVVHISGFGPTDTRYFEP